MKTKPFFVAVKPAVIVYVLYGHSRARLYGNQQISWLRASPGRVNNPKNTLRLVSELLPR